MTTIRRCAALAMILGVASSAPRAAQAANLDNRVWMLLAPAAAVVALIPLYPLMQSHLLDPVGFNPQPYTDDMGYAEGEKSWALALRASSQLTEGGRSAARAGARLTTAGRMGAGFDWTGFQRGALRSPGRTDYYVGHILGNLSESPDSVSEWGIGVATLRGLESRWGGSLELAHEWFARRPATLHARYQLGVLTDRRAYHDLSIHAGAVRGKFGISAGYRAFLNPLGDSYGPELALRAWF